MFDSLSPRLTAALLLTSLVVVPGCEPDECDLDFAFTVDEADKYNYVWRHPSTTCSYTDWSGTALSEFDTSALMQFKNGKQSVQIILEDGSFVQGPHQVSLVIDDENGSNWVSTESCLAVFDRAEVVDWVQEDHRRVTGVVHCDSPLIETTVNLDDPTPRYTELTQLQFNIYAGTVPSP